MPQTIFPLTRTLVRDGISLPGVVDLSPFGVPAGATGAILEVFNTNAGVRTWDVKKNGSTDNFLLSASGSIHAIGAVGVDAERKIYWNPGGATPRFALYLVGYTMPGVEFFTNGILISGGLVAGAWTDIDLSASIPVGAVGVIVRIVVTTAPRDAGLRMKGSTDNHIAQIGNQNNCFCAFIGCDANRVIQGYRNLANVNMYLMGYVMEGAVFLQNGIDMGSPPALAWVDAPELPVNGMAGFVEVFNGTRMWTRPKGAPVYSYSYGSISSHSWLFSGSGTNRIIQTMQSVPGGGFFLTGYATFMPPTAQTLSALGVT